MARKPYFRAFDGWWYAQLRVGTKRKQIKLIKGKENEQEAYRAFCRLVAEHEGEVPKPQATTVATVCDLFLEHSQRHNKPVTYEMYRHFLQDFCNAHGKKMPLDLKPFHVHRWLDTHLSWKGSRSHAISSVKRAFSWAVSEGLLDRNPIQTVKKPASGRRDRILNKEEREQILAAISDESFRDFVLAMQETGCRPSEVAALTASDLNLGMGIWTFAEHKTSHKTKKSRIVYLTPAMINLTSRLMKLYPEGPLFRCPRTDRAFSRNNIRCRFRRLRAKFPNLKVQVSQISACTPSGRVKNYRPEVRLDLTCFSE